jgi:hypothetical protein
VKNPKVAIIKELSINIAVINDIQNVTQHLSVKVNELLYLPTIFILAV